jgi:hypothetical protein
MIPPQAAIILLTRCVANAASTFLKPAVIAPFLLLSALQLLALLVYVHFNHPLLAGAAAPAIAAVFGDGVLHYPMHIWHLPVALDWIRFAAAIVPGTLLFAWAATAPPLRPPDDVGRRRRVRNRLLPLALATAGFAAILIGIQRGVGLLEDIPVVGRLQPVWIVLALVARPFLFVVLADVVFHVLADEHGEIRAIGEALAGLAGSVAVPLLLAVTGSLVLAPLHAAVAAAAWFVEGGMPDIVATAATIAVVWDALVLAFLLSATAEWRTQRGAVA